MAGISKRSSSCQACCKPFLVQSCKSRGDSKSIIPLPGFQTSLLQRTLLRGTYLITLFLQDWRDRRTVLNTISCLPHKPLQQSYKVDHTAEGDKEVETGNVVCFVKCRNAIALLTMTGFPELGAVQHSRKFLSSGSPKYTSNNNQPPHYSSPKNMPPLLLVSQQRHSPRGGASSCVNHPPRDTLQNAAQLQVTEEMLHH